MDRKWVDIAIGTVAFGLIFNYLWTDRRIKGDTVAAPDMEQNNLYPTNFKSPVGTHVAVPRRVYMPVAPLGGSSVVTSTTGRWAA